MRVFEMMYQSKIGTTLTRMLMIHLKTSIQNWNYTHSNVDDSFKDFYTKLEGSVNKHAPLKKCPPKRLS